MRGWRKRRPTYYKDLYNRLFNELRQLFGGKCQHCGLTEHLEFAHVKDTGLDGAGRGKKTRYYNIKNNKDCYILLTKKCHREFDKLSPELKEEWVQKYAKFNKEN